MGREGLEFALWEYLHLILRVWVLLDIGERAALEGFLQYSFPCLYHSCLLAYAPIRNFLLRDTNSLNFHFKKNPKIGMWKVISVATFLL